MYGKPDDRKHYEKIAKEIRKINGNVEVQVVAQDFPLPEDDPRLGTQRGLVIRTARKYPDWEWRHVFWVNPEDGCWVFRRGWGEGEHWEYSENLKWLKKGIFGDDMFDDSGLHYRHFASVTAMRFFRNGPLVVPGEEN